MTSETQRTKNWENTTPKWVECTYSDSGWAILEECFPDKILPDHMWLKVVDNAHPKVHFSVYHKLKMNKWIIPRIDDPDFDDSDRVEKKQWTDYTPFWVLWTCDDEGLQQIEEEHGKTLRCDWWDVLVERAHPSLKFRVYHTLKKHGWVVRAVDDPGFD